MDRGGGGGGGEKDIHVESVGFSCVTTPLGSSSKPKVSRGLDILGLFRRQISVTEQKHSQQHSLLTLAIECIQNKHHMEETHSLACGFPATPPMACWPICICPMGPIPTIGAPWGRGPMPIVPGPPPTPVRLVRAFMGSSRRVDNRE